MYRNFQRENTTEHCPTCRLPVDLAGALERLTAVVLELADHIAELVELEVVEPLAEEQ